MSCEVLGPLPAAEPLRGILDRKLGGCTSTSTPPPGLRFTFTKSKTLTDQFCPVWIVMLPAWEENLFLHVKWYCSNWTDSTACGFLHEIITLLFAIECKRMNCCIILWHCINCRKYEVSDFVWQFNYLLCFDKGGCLRYFTSLHHLSLLLTVDWKGINMAVSSHAMKV